MSNFIRQGWMLWVCLGALTLVFGLEIADHTERGRSHPVSAPIFVRDGDIVEGPTEAKPLLIFISPTCPACRHWMLNQEPVLLNNTMISHNFKLIIRQYPTDSIGIMTAAFIACSPEKIRRDVARHLYENQSWWGQTTSGEFAKEAQLNNTISTQIDACLPHMESTLITNTQADTHLYSIKATPSFIIDGMLYVGDIPTHSSTILNSTIR
jgi:protein-disulfide isomerase